jgi:hypothetical protein
MNNEVIDANWTIYVKGGMNIALLETNFTRYNLLASMIQSRPLTEMSTRNLPGGKGWTALEADKLIAICEPIVWKIWDPRCLTTLWASTACYRYSFISRVKEETAIEINFNDVIVLVLSVFRIITLLNCYLEVIVRGLLLYAVCVLVPVVWKNCARAMKCMLTYIWTVLQKKICLSVKWTSGM